MDKQPTQEQIKEFWEWCGVPKYSRYPDSKMTYDFYDIDLNNLFKCAVPKFPYVLLENCQAGYKATVSADMVIQQKVYSNDPALALFWAIQEVIHNDHTNDQSIR